MAGNLPDGCSQADIDRHAPEDEPTWESGENEPMTPEERALHRQDGLPLPYERTPRDRDEDEDEDEDIRF